MYQKSIKAILGMDADSRLAPGALAALWNDLMSQRNIGGVMAKYTMRMPKRKVNYQKMMFIMKKKLHLVNMEESWPDGGHNNKNKIWLVGY